jgi:hypothetical protein
MAITNDDISNVAKANADRGVKSLTIGDRRLDYLGGKDLQELLDLKKSLDNDSSGGLFKVEFSND